MPKKDILKQISSWFFQAKEATQNNNTDELCELPQSLITKLETEVEGLPCPTVYRTTVQNAIASGVKNWQQNLHGSNSLAILGSPVEPIDKIIDAALQNWQTEDLQVIRILPWLNRPYDSSEITTAIKSAVYPYYPELADNNGDILEQREDSLDKRLTVFVIQDLSQCFLRCINGWKSIEFFNNTVIYDKSYFWVIGCNYWSWNFLDHVCQISAYFEETQHLPTLDSEAIQEWLNPVVETLIQQKKQTEENAESQGETYWETLAEKSKGLSQVIAPLWLQSLRFPKENSEKLTASQSEVDLSLEDLEEVEQIEPKVPSLPTLKPIDRYLLNSILMHGKISRSHLSLSLGEAESMIRSRLQVLLRTGVIQQKDNLLAVNPLYYPKIKTELEYNNFLTEEA